MKPKSHSELREKVIFPLYSYLKVHSDLIEAESQLINEALRLLVIADCHLFHLGISHSKASRLERESESVSDDLSF